MWDYLKTTEKPILLYGMGNGADRVLDELQRRQIPVQGVFASDGFVRSQVFRGFTVISYSEAKALFGDMVVLLCFGTQRPEVLEQIRLMAREQEVYAPDVPVIGDGLFTRDYARRHREELEQVYAALADEQSRLVFRSVVEYKITGRIQLLFDCETPPEEAFETILCLGEQENYLDLGAYTGDTIAEFLRHTGGSYSHIYAAEPDEKTFRKLQQNTAELANCQLFPVGIGDRWEQLPFAARGGRNSAVGQAGRLQQMDSVDNLLYGRPVSYIKVDVEGQEAAFIRGAAKTITRHRPKMLLSAYHRTEDLFALPLQVLALQPDYRLYLRHHPYLPAWDVNYYFV